ncbi:type II toxin-antitoxin system RelE/ParE family toxin [Photobacterium sp. TY1-4]|uniref:type II toxin-antitoxin system RelE/ParE family toxin n=1 Tax=Photobacterium sp. TY1-4 TaxID=2899122 RepID=UPI0021BE4ED4|nr:type II toxin-antitoxin system RelE/ParE family toxin [Photobacterium sp. TY1-4]UXI02372.1 type II toxin-antitoxin system RelE/ParE family toxin [Photobacterium sp. TY1-4]
MKVVWSPLALQKLGDAAEFISLDNPAAAGNWVNEVFDQTELLGTMPEMGRMVPEMPDTHYREIIFGHYRIIYSLSHEIRVLTVRNCRQILTEDDV